ncbi:MAG: F-box protein [Candidatus Margulisiibacteriota bacterium]|nr:F-box protein [Candidatus Margulisiibacteriota bacterium]
MISMVTNKPFTLFKSLPDDKQDEILSHLTLIDRLRLKAVSKQFTNLIPEGLQIQSLAQETLKQLAKDEAALWIDKKLVKQKPNELIRNICENAIIIPRDLVKETVFTILIERGANLKDGDARDGYNLALIWAAHVGHVEVLKVLIDQFQINLTEAEITDLKQIATQYNQQSVLDYLNTVVIEPAPKRPRV